MKLTLSVLLLAMAPQLAAAIELYKEKEASVSVGGNFQFDVGSIDDLGSAASRNGFWRRQRLSLEVATEHVDIEVEFDSKTNLWTDAFIRVRGIGPGQLQLGQFKHFFGLDQLVSSRKTLFLERSFSDSAFLLGRRLGAGYSFSQARYGAAVSAFGRNLNRVPSSDGLSARGWLSPSNEDGHVTHFGMAFTREFPDQDRLGFAARASTRLSDFRVARTGTFGDAQSLSRIALESAGVRGSWMWQSELVGVTVARDATGFDGWAAYGMLGYTFGKAHRSYKDGVIDGISGSGPSFELGARIDLIDLDDGLVRGGKATALGLVGSWYLDPNSRVMLNIIQHARRDQTNDPRVIEARFQFSF